jgi:hypothetical protein
MPSAASSRGSASGPASGSGTIRSSMDWPVSSSRSPSSRTVDSAHVPPTKPSRVPSGSTSALSPALALVGRCADHRGQNERGSL